MVAAVAGNGMWRFFEVKTAQFVVLWKRLAESLPQERSKLGGDEIGQDQFSRNSMKPWWKTMSAAFAGRVPERHPIHGIELLVRPGYQAGRTTSPSRPRRPGYWGEQEASTP